MTVSGVTNTSPVLFEPEMTAAIETPNPARPPATDLGTTGMEGDTVVDGAPGVGATDAAAALATNPIDQKSTYEKVAQGANNNFHAAQQIEEAVIEGKKDPNRQALDVKHIFQDGKHHLEFFNPEGNSVGTKWSWKEKDLPPTHKIDEQLDNIFDKNQRTFTVRDPIRAEHMDHLIKALEGENGGNHIIVPEVEKNSGTLSLEQTAFARIDKNGHAVLDHNGTMVLAELGEGENTGPKKIDIKGTKDNDNIVTLYDVPTKMDGLRGNDDLVAFRNPGDGFTQKIELSDRDGKNFMALVNGKGSITAAPTSGTEAHLHPSMRRSEEWGPYSNKIAVVNGEVKVNSQAAYDAVSVGGNGKHKFTLEGPKAHFIQDFTSEKKYEAKDLKIGENTVVAFDRMDNGRVQEGSTEFYKSGGRSFFGLVNLPPIRLDADGSGESKALSAESIKKNQSHSAFWGAMMVGVAGGATAGIAAIIKNNSSGGRKSKRAPAYYGHPPGYGAPGPGYGPPLGGKGDFFSLFFEYFKRRG